MFVGKKGACFVGRSPGFSIIWLDLDVINTGYHKGICPNIFILAYVDSGFL